jgi:hypothetical protein
MPQESALERLAESAGELFQIPSSDTSVSAPANPAPCAAQRPASDRPAPASLSRRAMVATLAAAFAPAPIVALPKIAQAAAASVALPAVLAPPASSPAGESAELLALGAEVDTKLEAYRAAGERLTEARAIAKALWPDVPEILVTTRDDRQLYEGCYSREKDAEGADVWPGEYRGADGKIYGRLPRQLFVAEALKTFLSEFGYGPRTKTGRRFKPVIAAAEKYEAACDHAITSSGIEAAKAEAERRASDIHSLLFEFRKHAPRSMIGVLMLARAVMALEEAQQVGERAGGFILGRELAEAVLRLSQGGRTDA